MDELTDVTITAEDANWLAEFTTRLINDGLAACGNIVGGVRSVYTWQGKVEQGTEALLVLHTRKQHVSAIIERVDAEHPDDTPQVLALPVSDAHPGYRDWLLQATGGA
ncbi:MAG TPA: divalent-cation tolerance protein CutA [Candidatus Stackebrandtia faecavium]|nr:divalent-cation tolerance protein CutA [Candidatus Stackebrandtia faecavium]